MSLPLISVIIPTVEGREDHLDRCVHAYRRRSPDSMELIVEHDRPTCGLGWHMGAKRAAGEYLHFTCDDIEPRAGWWEPAVEAVKDGFIPAPQVYGADGTPQSHPVWGQSSPDWCPVYMTSLPFVSREQFGVIVPLLTCHYFHRRLVQLPGRARWLAYPAARWVRVHASLGFGEARCPVRIGGSVHGE